VSLIPFEHSYIIIFMKETETDHASCCCICLQDLAFDDGVNNVSKNKEDEQNQSFWRIPGCGHWFHGECIHRWEECGGCWCPMDRIPYKKEDLRCKVPVRNALITATEPPRNEKNKRYSSAFDNCFEASKPEKPSAPQFTPSLENSPPISQAYDRDRFVTIRIEDLRDRENFPGSGCSRVNSSEIFRRFFSSFARIPHLFVSLKPREIKQRLNAIADAKERDVQLIQQDMHPELPKRVKRRIFGFNEAEVKLERSLRKMQDIDNEMDYLTEQKRHVQTTIERKRALAAYVYDMQSSYKIPSSFKVKRRVEKLLAETRKDMQFLECLAKRVERNILAKEIAWKCEELKVNRLGVSMNPSKDSENQS